VDWWIGELAERWKPSVNLWWSFDEGRGKEFQVSPVTRLRFGLRQSPGAFY